MELAVVAGGGGTHFINEEVEPFDGLDVVFTPGDIPHCWKFDKDLCPPDGMVDDCCCQFNPSLLTGLARLYPEFGPMVDFFTSLRQSIQITGDTARRIKEMIDSMGLLSEMREVMLILEIFALIFETQEFRTIGMPMPVPSKDNRATGRLHLIDRIISENYDRKITLGEVASALGMSPTAFCNAFKAMAGTTFYRYLTDYRMRIASRLLRDTRLNVSEIGYRTGYPDVAHFTRAFTAHFHLTPTSFRNQ